ncbi:MAG: DUF47 family protein [Candidatus Micrarchaeota archaeon]
MNIIDWIVPREKRFFHMLAAESAIILKGARELERGFANGHLVGTAKRLKCIETEGDDQLHSLFSELNKTFITPIDREDISSLATMMDDVLDASYEAAERAELYGIKQIPVNLARLSELLSQGAQEMNQAVTALDRMRGDEIRKRIIRINELESRAEEVQRQGLKELFKDKDPILVIKLKDIYASVEHAMDRCEDVSHVLGDIIMKHG